MSMNLNVHSVHKIEHEPVGVCGWDECSDFIDRLSSYAYYLGASTPNQVGYGEGYSNWEIPICSIEKILEQDDEFFTEEVEDGRLEDKAIIQKMYDKSDKDGEDYIFIDAF